MNHIFISYSSAYRDFAIKLADQLERFYKVWIDREGIEGGEEWEKEIEQALKECSVFVVLVSLASNESTWVRRETLMAERLKKPCMPLLLNGDMPLRLINLQYIDFRGDFEGGLRDLYEILRTYLNPEEKIREDVNQLIGAGVRAWLGGNFAQANDFIGQALALQPDLASDVEAFWGKLQTRPTTQFAEQFKKQIAQGWQPVVESSETLKENVYESQAAYKWTISINADAQTLDQIDYVVYELHPTFAQPLRTIRDRASNFSLTMVGWGVFDIPVQIYFKDGSHVETTYTLKIDAARE